MNMETMGDANGMLTHSKVLQQPSPDRLTRSVFYEEHSMRMVCQVCRFNDDHRERSDRKEESSGATLPLTYSHLFEMEQIMTERSTLLLASAFSDQNPKTHGLFKLLIVQRKYTFFNQIKLTRYVQIYEHII